MTYCLGILSKEGIAGLADTRITSGSDTTVAKKIFTVQRSKHTYFIMTSGLRSVRDKTLTYFSEVIEAKDNQFNKLYKAVNQFGEQVKRVADEDKANLEASGLKFNIHAIVGGQLEEDAAPKMYLLYPQGNWIEVAPGTPYVIIGNTGFGSPILKRSISFESSLELGMKIGFLSFDATRISANDVDYPIDTVVLKKDKFKLFEHRFQEKDLRDMAEFWNASLSETIEKLPASVLDKAFEPTEKKMTILQDASSD